MILRVYVCIQCPKQHSSVPPFYRSGLVLLVHSNQLRRRQDKSQTRSHLSFKTKRRVRPNLKRNPKPPSWTPSPSILSQLQIRHHHQSVKPIGNLSPHTRESGPRALPGSHSSPVHISQVLRLYACGRVLFMVWR